MSMTKRDLYPVDECEEIDEWDDCREFDEFAEQTAAQRDADDHEQWERGNASDNDSRPNWA